MPNRTVITSRQHPVCKLVHALHDVKGRRKHKLFVVEGGNAVAAALRVRWPLQRLLSSPDDLEAGWDELARTAGIEVVPVSPEILEYLSDAQTSPGVIALANLPAPSSDDWDSSDLLLVLDGIGDPGNIGTLIRTADAAGASGVVLTENSADAFNPKVIRSTAGSLFNLTPLTLAENTPEAIANALHQRRIPIVAAVAHGGEDCFRYRWPQRCALVLGHETRGISPALEEAATSRVTIPIYGRAESLNVASAGAVLMYSWRSRVA